MEEKIKRNVVFVSDGTGITIASLAQALITQFPNVEFEETMFSFISDSKKAKEVIEYIKNEKQKSGLQPLVFSSFTSEEIKSLFNTNEIEILDIFSIFLPSMENYLTTQASLAAGAMHGLSNTKSYDDRIDALNYTLNHDDGLLADHLEQADVVITGVSRSGKTPTCLYLALHFELKAANYPLADSDFDQQKLPHAIDKIKNKLIGLTISPQQLSRIREKRRPNSKYASYEQCIYEVSRAEKIFNEHRIEYLDTSSISIEEIATNVIQKLHLKIERKW